MKTMACLSRSRKRILYIEDHEDSRQMLTMLLESKGYEMVTATTVAGGVSLAGVERFDLYILDSIFADGTGIDLCRQIRAFDPDTPIIFFSSAAYEYDIEAGKAAGAQYYLTKPTGILVIEQTIADLLASTTGRGLTYRLSDPAQCSTRAARE
jgi:DNA-binding response OmpR family regulator